ncbi:MAG: mechanosensitive ion channel [Bacteroidales bacterium]|nr:mechanosensitive ion channel [Bacteroidales bacterium]MCB9000032.1 mechanosensitive ion channel [Bacteroidales bacterium]MCB9013606.1 mechanosensitive ion channel [Bacteroidales bacterium]
MDTVNEFLQTDLINIGKYNIKVSDLLVILLIFIFTKLALWLIKKAMFRNRKQNSVDTGNVYALFQIIKYVIWVIAIGVILERIGIKLTVLLAGSAALLVGIGLGLQQTFNDIVSGIILLSERSIRVGDILEIDGDIIKIQDIGLRTSKGLNRDEISIIIPNSSITTNKVINWSHQSMKTRFRINVGVAYGSDVEKVLKVLRESAMEHPDISDNNMIEVRLVDFGNSSLDFQILFFSKNIFRIERVKSDIRKIISRKLNENGITIPFPQMDVYIKQNVDKK